MQVNYVAARSRVDSHLYYFVSEAIKIYFINKVLEPPTHIDSGMHGYKFIYTAFYTWLTLCGNNAPHKTVVQICLEGSPYFIFDSQYTEQQ